MRAPIRGHYFEIQVSDWLAHRKSVAHQTTYLTTFCLFQRILTSTAKVRATETMVGITKGISTWETHISASYNAETLTRRYKCLNLRTSGHDCLYLKPEISGFSDSYSMRFQRDCQGITMNSSEQGYSWLFLLSGLRGKSILRILGRL